MRLTWAYVMYRIFDKKLLLFKKKIKPSLFQHQSETLCLLPNNACFSYG